MITARLLEEVDLPTIERFLYPAAYGTHREDWDRQCAGLASMMVAWLACEPIGSGFIHWPGPRDTAAAAALPGCPEISRLSVRRRYRSKGAGTQLISGLESLALERGRSRIGLGVSLNNHRARSLYERLGYRLAPLPQYVDRWQYPGANGERVTVEDPCHFLVKDLKPGPTSQTWKHP